MLITGDEYEHVELFKNIPIWMTENVPEDFIGVKSDTFTIFISSGMIASIELEETTNLKVISS